MGTGGTLYNCATSRIGTGGFLYNCATSPMGRGGTQYNCATSSMGTGGTLEAIINLTLLSSGCVGQDYMVRASDVVGQAGNKWSSTCYQVSTNLSSTSSTLTR